MKQRAKNFSQLQRAAISCFPRFHPRIVTPSNEVTRVFEHSLVEETPREQVLLFALETTRDSVLWFYKKIPLIVNIISQISMNLIVTTY